MAAIVRRKTKAEIGAAAANLIEDMRTNVLSLVGQYRDPIAPELAEPLIRQAVDTPHRARARLQNWLAQYDAQHGAGAGVALIDECLIAAGSSETVASLNAALTAAEAQAATLVDNVNNQGWTWDQVADWFDANLYDAVDVDLTYRTLPLPAGYVDVWGDPWN